MRPNSKVHDRFEISLDGWQVAAVVVGALVVLGAVFVLGLGVGRQVAVRGLAAPRTDAPGVGEAAGGRRPAPGPDPREKEPRLSFHEALTKGAPDPAPITETRPRPLNDPEGRAAGTALPPVSAHDLAPAAATPRSPAAASAPLPGAREPVRDPAPKVSAPMPARPAPRAPAPAAPDPVAKAVARAAALPADHAGGMRYAVQVGASQSEAEAGRLQKRLAAEGARVAVADVPGKGRWFRVKVGSYATRAEAEERLAALVRQGIPGFVTDAR